MQKNSMSRGIDFGACTDLSFLSMSINVLLKDEIIGIWNITTKFPTALIDHHKQCISCIFLKRSIAYFEIDSNEYISAKLLSDISIFGSISVYFGDGQKHSSIVLCDVLMSGFST